MRTIENYFERQPSLARALSLFSGRDAHTAAQAAEDLASLLAPTYRSQWLHNAWKASTLTYNRFPVEFAFSSLNDSIITFTTEIDAPEIEPQYRLNKANQLLHSLGVTPFPPAAMELFKNIQEAGNLTYGAWLGAKYNKQSRRFKLYLQVPDPGSPHVKNLISTYLGEDFNNLGVDCIPVMIGKETQKNSIEFYYEITNPHFSKKEIASILEKVDLKDKTRDILALANEARSMSTYLEKAHWPTCFYGFSLAVHPEQNAVIFTIFTFAESFLGGDGVVRNAVLTMADRYGWDFSLYAQLSEPLTRLPNKSEYHGVISFAVGNHNEPGLSLGLCPPGPPGYPETILDGKKELIILNSRIHENLEPHKERETLTAEILACQVVSGAFTSFVRLPNGKQMPDENGFFTAMVLRCLSGLPGSPALNQARDRALDFLQTCEIPGKPGAFSFWPQHAHPTWMKDIRLMPDVDDSAVIALELYRHKRKDHKFLHNATAKAIFPYRKNKVNKTEFPWQHCGCFLTWLNETHQPNHVDCCVNVNALTLLAQIGMQDHPAYAAAAQTVNDAMAWAGDSLQRLAGLTLYYPHPVELYFAVKNALDNGVSILEQNFDRFKNIWEEKLLSVYGEITPVFSRENGVILWNAPVLYKARRLSGAFASIRIKKNQNEFFTELNGRNHE